VWSVHCVRKDPGKKAPGHRPADGLLGVEIFEGENGGGGAPGLDVDHARLTDFYRVPQELVVIDHAHNVLDVDADRDFVLLVVVKQTPVHFCERGI